MITTLVVMWFSGGLVGFALAVQWGKAAKMHADERLVERNAHLEAEVVRLRAQVALHIGTEYAPLDPTRSAQCRPEGHREGPSIVALRPGAR